MDIKDSYLHGTVGVVKSISVTADKLKYKLADKKGTSIEVTMPTATQSANGLLSSADKKKLDSITGKIKDSDIIWGTDGITGGISPIDNAASYLHSGNKLLFARPEGITIEYSTNGGSTWIDYGATDDQKIALVSGLYYNSYKIGKGLSTKVLSTDLLRITLHATNMNVYTVAKSLLIDLSTDGSNSCKVKLETATKGSPASFSVIGEYPVQGWSGWNRIPLNTITFGGGPTLTSHVEIIRLTFTTTGTAKETGGHAYIMALLLLGATNWTTPSNMAKTGHLYSWNSSLDAAFPALITATLFNGPATKLQTKRKLWGQNFDGTADVSGSLTGVSNLTASGQITAGVFYGKGSLGGAALYAGHREGLALGIEPYDKDGKWLNCGILLFQDGNVSIGTTSNYEKLYVNGNVKATSFIGNLDGTYVNKLTGYSKATTKGAIAATDTLNVALGKLEFKADAAYDLVKGAYDGDGTIENLAEILKVLEGIKDTETIQAIIGKYLPLAGGIMTGDVKWESGTGHNTRLPAHIYRNSYNNDGRVFDHYYHPGEKGYTNSIAELRVKSGDSYHTLRFGGDGAFTWMNHNVLHANNYTSYTVKKDGTGASGTWNINISGKAPRAVQIDTTSIKTEQDIVESGLRTYAGSGTDWTGSIKSMLYAAIISLGGPSRGLQMWARRGTGAVSSIHYRVGKEDTTGWEAERILLDNYNSSVTGTNSSITVNLGGTSQTLTIPSSLPANGGTASSANWLNPNYKLEYGASGLNYFNINGTEGNDKSNCTPTSSWYHIIRMNHGNSVGYLVDIAAPVSGTSGIYWRQIANGTFRGWYEILDSNNYNSYALPLTGGTLTGRLTISNDNWGSLLVLNRNNNGSNWGPAILFNIEGSNVGTLTMASDNLYIGNNGSIRYRAWHEGNDGSGSGLDADLLDGTHKADLFTSLTNVNTKANPYSLSATIGGTTKYLQVAHSKNTLNLNAERFDTDAPLPNTYTGLTFQFSNNVDQGWSNVLTMRSYNDYNYTCAQIITPANNPSKDTGYSGDMKWRLGRNSTWLDWKTILDSSNTHIKSGVITINGTTITPLTQHQSLTNYVTLDTNQNITGYKTFKRDTTAFTIQSSTGNSTIKFVNSGMTSWFGFSSARGLFYTDDKWEEAYYVLSSANYNSYLPVKLINDPGRTVLIASYGLNANYGTGDYGNPVEEYLMAFSKYLLDKAAGYTCIGYIQPGSRGSYICDIYNSGTNSTTGLPVHITGHFFPHGGNHYHFGTSYGTWYWYTALHSANYTNYTVTKTGGGASGTWGISITGNAATATTASKVTCQEQSSDKDRPIVLTNTSNLLYYSTKATVNYSSGHIKAGALTINSVLDYSAYPETDTLKMGTTMGSIHFNGDLKDKGSAITWGYSSYGSADSGIYVKHNGSYGSKMYFATTNVFNDGPKAAMLIDNVGDIYALRGNFVGTLKGSVISNLTTGSHLAGNKGTAIINSTASGNGYTMLAKMNSSNGVFCQGSYNDAYKLFYTANTVISEGTNTFTYGATLLDEDGNSTFPGTVNVRNLKITSTAQARHIEFSRVEYNYITAPDGGTISLNARGTVYAVDGELNITKNVIKPGTTNRTSLGTSDLRWSKVYSVLGNFSGQITSTVATGTAPFAISSTTKVDNLNADMLDGLHGDWYRKNTVGFTATGTSADEEYDCNTLRDGIIYNYASSKYWKNAPGGISYGQVLNLRKGDDYNLMGLLAWDVLHNSTTDTTRYLWWRASDDGSLTEAKWHRIAYIENIPTITNYYWANVKISDSSSTTTAPTFGSVTTSTIKSDNTILYLKYKNDDTKSIALTDTAFTPTNAATDKINLGTSSNRWKSLYTSKLFIDNTGKLMPIDTNSRSAGVYGVYDPTKVGHVWSMGREYKISDDGRSTNTMYGLVYFHTKWSNSTEYNTATRGDKLITEVDVYASGHLIAMVSNGTVVSSLGDYVWSRYGFKKFNSSDSYVLLGGGGHKTISSLSVASATTANSLKSTAIVTDKAFSLVNTKWTDVDGTYDNLAAGTYAVQITSGSNLVASGIMSYKNSSDTAGDEIPLHVHSTVNWRPYLRTYGNKLLISSNDTSAASRTVTIKIA